VINSSWGTKRNCPSCSAHFYDLNKTPATCPKCNHHFDPAALVRTKRKITKRDAPEEKKAHILPTILAKKAASKKKDKKQVDEDTGDNMGDVAEMEDVDDIENLQGISELEEMAAEQPLNEDDADDESIIEELNAGDKGLVGNVEEEEAEALIEELDEDDQESSLKKQSKTKKKNKKE